MKAVELLKEDHRVVEHLFRLAEESTPAQQAKIFKDIKNELEAHAHVEEKIFYPALKRAGDKDAKDMVLEGFEEHHYMKISLAEIARLRSSSEKFPAKLKVMIEMMRHHVKEEEATGGLFSMAEEHLGDEKLEKLGASIEREKAKYVKENGITPVSREIAKGTLDKVMSTTRDLLNSVLSRDPEQKPKAAGKKKAAPPSRAAAAASR